MPNLLTHTFHLQPLSRSQALEAVLKPGRHLLTPARAFRIVDAIIRAGEHRKSTPATAAAADPAPRRSASTTVDPAILSLVCARLNERRFSAPGAKGERRVLLPEISDEIVNTAQPEDVVEEFYIEATNQVSPALRRFIEEELSTADGYRATLPETDAYLECPKYGIACGPREQIASELDSLCDSARRILIREPEGGIWWLRLGHDLLAEAAARVRSEREQAEEVQQREQERVARANALTARRRFIGVAALAALATLSTVGFFAAHRTEAKARAHVETLMAEVKNHDLANQMWRVRHDLEKGDFARATALCAEAIRMHPTAEFPRLLLGNQIAIRPWLLPSREPEVIENCHCCNDSLVVEKAGKLLIRTAQSAQPLEFACPQCEVAALKGQSIVRLRLTAAARLGSEDVWIAGFDDGSLFLLPAGKKAIRFSPATNEKVASVLACPRGKSIFVVWDQVQYRGSRSSQFRSIPSKATLASGKKKLSELFTVHASDVVEERAVNLNAVDAAFSRDGAYLLIAAGRQVFAYETRTGKKVAASYESSGPIALVRVNPNTELGKDGRHVTFASASEDGYTRVAVFTPSSGTVITADLRGGSRGYASRPVCLEWLPSGAGIVTGWDDGSLTVIGLNEALEGLLVASREGRSCVAQEVDPVFLRAPGTIPATRIAISSDSTRLATLTENGALGVTILPLEAASLYDLPQETSFDLQIGGHGESVSFGSDGAEIVTVTAGGSGTATLQFFSARHRTLLPWNLEHGDRIDSATYCPGRRRLFVLAGSKLEVWDPMRRHLERTTPLESADLLAIGCGSPLALTASAAVNDKMLRFWRVGETAELIGEPVQHHSGIRALLYSEASLRACTLDTKGVHLWQAVASGPGAGLKRLGRTPLTAPNATGTCDGVALSAEGDLLVAWWKEKAGLWQITDTGNLAEHPLEFPSAVTKVVIAPDSTRMVCALDQGGAEIVVLGGQGEAFKEQRLPCRLARQVDALQFSPDGLRLAGSLSDKRVMVWDARTGELLVEPLDHPEAVTHLSFSACGQLLLTCAGRQMRCWNLETGIPAWPGISCREELREAHFMEGDAYIWILLENSIAVLPVLRPGPEDAGLLAEYAEIAAGVSVDNRGVRVAVPNRWGRLQALRARNELSPITKWLLTPDMDLNERPVAPGAPITLRLYLEELWTLEGDAAEEEAAVLRIGTGLKTPSDASNAPPPR